MTKWLGRVPLFSTIASITSVALYAANLSDSHSLKFDIANVNSHSLGIRGVDVKISILDVADYKTTRQRPAADPI